jgi:hypothetical protein
MTPCRILNHTITVEYLCPTNNESVTVTVDRPSIWEGARYEDDHYRWFEVYKCPLCGKSHMIEL